MVEDQDRVHSRLKDGMSSTAPQAIKENSLELSQMTELTFACASRPDTSDQYEYVRTISRGGIFRLIILKTITNAEGGT
jgi:fructose-1-phosphate kinase PfkB-like protein